MQKWLDNDPKASWESIVSALEDISMNRLPAEIKRKYIFGSTESIRSVTDTVTADGVKMMWSH